MRHSPQRPAPAQSLRFAPRTVSLVARAAVVMVGVLAGSAAFPGTPARAQAAQRFQLDAAPVPTGPDDGIQLQRPRVLAARSVQVQLRTDYAYRALVVGLRGAVNDTIAVVGHRMTGALSVSYGVVDRLSLFITLPFVLHQVGEGVLGQPAPSARGLSDLTIGMNAHLFGGADGAQLGVGLALIEPTGSVAAFASDNRVGANVQLRFAYRASRWSLGASAGVTLRPDREWLTHQTGADLSLIVGAFVNPAEGLRLGLELGATTGLTDHTFLEPSRTPLEATLSGRLTLDYGLYVVAATGVGLAAGVGAPRVRATLALGWASAQLP